MIAVKLEIKIVAKTDAARYQFWFAMAATREMLWPRTPFDELMRDAGFWDKAGRV